MGGTRTDTTGAAVSGSTWVGRGEAWGQPRASPDGRCKIVVVIVRWLRQSMARLARGVARATCKMKVAGQFQNEIANIFLE